MQLLKVCMPLTFFFVQRLSVCGGRARSPSAKCFHGLPDERQLPEDIDKADDARVDVAGAIDDGGEAVDNPVGAGKGL